MSVLQRWIVVTAQAARSLPHHNHAIFVSEGIAYVTQVADCIKLSKGLQK